MANIYTTLLPKKIEKDLFNHLLLHVNKKKQIKINAITHEQTANASLIGDLLARYCLCTTLDIHNQQLDISISPNGKPYLNNHNLYFNISHKENLIVCGISQNPIGIDVEHIKPRKYEAIAKKNFSPKEWDDLMSLKESERLTYFYRIWTLKESYIKAIGKGLSHGLSHFTFDINHKGITMVPNHIDRPYNFSQVQLDEHHLVAVCTQDKINTEPIEIKFSELIRLF